MDRILQGQFLAGADFANLFSKNLNPFLVPVRLTLTTPCRGTRRRSPGRRAPITRPRHSPARRQTPPASPYSWTATGLAAGLVLSTAGVLSGTPAAAGDSTLTVVVTDAGGAMQTARFAR